MAGKALALVAAALIGFGSATGPASAQDQAPPDLEALIKQKLRADKKVLVAANMSLTDDEARGFWPLYDAYQADLEQANRRVLALIRDYVVVYRNDDEETNKVALKLVDERVAIEQAEAMRDLAYVEKLAAVLPPRKVIRYLQVESKVRAIVRYELADRIPIIE